MKKFFIIGFYFLFVTQCFGQAIPDSMRYFGQTSPGDTPKVFAPGYISGTGWVNTLSFSSDGKKMIFTKWIDNATHPRLFYSKYDNQNWSQPVQQSFTGMYEMEGIFAPYGNQLYFAAGDMSGGKWSPDDLWMVENQSQGWTTPVKVSGLNTSDYEFFATQTFDTTIFFQRSTDYVGDIYYAKYKNGSFSTPVRMDEPINSSARWSFHPCISPDGSFLIIELGDNTDNDLWISFRKSDNTWSALKNLGNKINTSQFIEGKPTLSPDGKFLFFARQNNSVCDIYWVSTRVIDSLKQIETSVEAEKQVTPKDFALNQNYPNPFNPSTVISYQLSVISNVKLSIFDMLGREVATLVNEKKPAGSYAVQWNAMGMPSGIYFYRLQAGTYAETKKLILLK